MNAKTNVNERKANILIDDLQFSETAVNDREMASIEGGWFWLNSWERAPRYYYAKTAQYKKILGIKFKRYVQNFNIYKTRASNWFLA